MKKKIITIVLLGFLMFGTLIRVMKKPSIQHNNIVLDYDDDDDPKKLIGG